MRKPLLVLAGLAGFALAVVPALGKDESIGAQLDNTFSPDTVTVDVGDTVTISNTLGGDHNLHWEDRADAEMPHGPSWTTSRRFDAPGNYRFYCEVHKGDGMTGVVVVRASDTTTTTTQATTGTTTTATTTDAPPATTSTAPADTTTSTVVASSADTRAPRLTARAGALRRRLQLVFALSERARVVAVIRGAGQRTTVRFVLVPGIRRRVLLRFARPGRYTITLTATDEAGNRSRAVRKTVRVQG